MLLQLIGRFEVASVVWALPAPMNSAAAGVVGWDA
jgi:hypothetical protein